MNHVLKIIALLAGLLLLATVAYRQIFAPAEPTALTISEARGEAQVAGGGNAPWQPVQKGQSLAAGARLKTGEDGTLLVRSADGDEMALSRDTELVVKDLDPEGASFELSYGQVKATVTHFGARTFKVGVAGNPVQVQTSRGSFTMTHDGNGSFDVVANEGEVQTVNGQEKAPVEVGQRKVFGEGGAELSSASATAGVLLKVQWPEKVQVGQPVEVIGSTDAGAQVNVGGVSTQVSADGTFTARVALPEGGVIEARARTSVGEKSERSPSLLAPATPPPPTPPPEPTSQPRQGMKLDVKADGTWR